ncbi:MAG TPA: hypothetical protein VJW76_15075 [Verrucomicrobiae bacterium]|nr:hypothetical protein [Verrucomicrobiae bacterium]
MKQLIAILLVIGAIWGVRQLQLHWDQVKAKKLADEGGAPVLTPAATAALPGLPTGLESSLQTAQKQGAAGLRNWLKAYRAHVTDPRLAAIELDYVVLVGASNIKEARQVLAAVKQRTPTNSPVYPRIKQLERNYP